MNRLSAVVPVTFDSTANSNVIKMLHHTIGALEIDAAFTSSELTINAGMDATTLKQVRDDNGAVYTIPVAAGQVISLDNLAFLFACRNIQFVGNADEAAARTCYLHLK